MKKIKLTFFVLLLFTCIANIQVSAVENPYPTSQTIGGITTIPCTRYAWQQAYDKTGVALPNFGNAVNWYERAKSSGYSVGSVAKPNSIAVWSGDTYGHVSYVVSVNGSKMTVNEAGMVSNGAAYNGTGIFNGNVVNSIVGQQKGNGSTKILIGFIYLAETPAPSFESVSNKNTITDTNAVLWGLLTKPSEHTVSKIGIQIRMDGQNYSDSTSKFDLPSKNYSGEPKVYIYYDMNNELGLTLKHATKYFYRFYAQINGNEYWSDEYSIATTGTHSYSTWTTISSASCTDSGIKQRTCVCGAKETTNIPALDHNYSSNWTIDITPTCTALGSKSHHCMRCTSRIDITPIPKTEHSYGAWKIVNKATCTNMGSEQRICICGSYENSSIPALGHEFSTEMVIDKAATCTTPGSKSRHCTRCTAVSDITYIPTVWHNWQEWKVEKEATVLEEGLEIRTCSTCSEAETKTTPKLNNDGHSHTFGEWNTVKQPTCTEKGMSERKCSICSAKETMNISTTEHTFGEWKITSEATETHNGTMERSCKNCTKTDTMIIPILVEKETDIENEPVTDVPLTDYITNDYNISTDVNTTANEPLDTTTNSNTEKSNNIPYIPLIIGAVIIIGVTALITTFIFKKKMKS